MKFDVVVGNPPYQSGKGNGSHPIYRDIIKKGIQILNKNGFLGIVSPPGFLNTTNIRKASNLFQLLKEGNLLTVDLNVNRYFPNVGSPICYIIWQNSKYQNQTVIDGNVIDINNFTFIPRIFNKKAISIIEKLTSGGNKLNTKYRKKSSQIAYRVAFKELNHISSKKGNIKAVILEPNSSNSSFYSFIKECSSKEEANMLLSFLNGKLVSLFNFVVRYNNVLHNGVIGEISVPKDLSLRTDMDFYNYFGLTSEEIRYIEENIT